MKVTPLKFLSAVAYVMRLDKVYKPRKTYQNASTADQARLIAQTEGYAVEVDDEVMAEEAIGYVETLDGANEFNANLKKFLLATEIDLSNSFATGTAAYGIQLLKREMEKEARVASNKDSKSTHQGAEGERIEFVGKHVSYAERINADGSNYSVTRVEDTKGNVFQAYGLARKTPGETIAIKGTVKKHLERDGIKFTTLSRALWTDGTGITAAEEKTARKKVREAKKVAKKEEAFKKFDSAMKEAYGPKSMCPNHPNRQSVGPSSNLCWPCLRGVSEPGEVQANEP